MKRCTKCGIEKDRSEFYVHRVQRNGTVVVTPECKQCNRRRKANKKRKTFGEYRTLAEIQAAKKPVEFSERFKEQKRWKELGQWEWAKALRRAISTQRARVKYRTASLDAWTRKMLAIVSGIRNSKAVRMRTRKHRHAIVSAAWDHALPLAIKRYKARMATRESLQDPWYRKLSNMALNWRRKAAAR